MVIGYSKRQLFEKGRTLRVRPFLQGTAAEIFRRR